MGNILAVAQKETKAYFSSPIAYVVIGLFALLFGYFYVAILQFFIQQSMQGGQFGMPAPVNVNQQMIRPVLLNTTVVFLFVLPMVTMRTFAEEKRSGTIELLLTSPLTDLQLIIGKFLGTLVMFAGFLAVMAIYVGILFFFGEPEWKPVVTAFFGLLLMGGAFLSVGLFVSSLTKNQIVAGMLTFAVFLLLWIIDWIGSFVGPTLEPIFTYLSITQHFDDFAKGVIDTKHILYYLSFITFGLFLTAKSVDSERWRG